MKIISVYKKISIVLKTSFIFFKQNILFNWSETFPGHVLNSFCAIHSRTFQHSCTSPVCSWTFLHLWRLWIQEVLQYRTRLNLCLGKCLSTWTHLYWDCGGLHVSVWRDIWPLESLTGWHKLQETHTERENINICCFVLSFRQRFFIWLLLCISAEISWSCAWSMCCLYMFKYRPIHFFFAAFGHYMPNQWSMCLCNPK